MKPYGLPNRVMSELMAKIFESDNLLKYIYYTGKEHEDIDIFSLKRPPSSELIDKHIFIGRRIPYLMKEVGAYLDIRVNRYEPLPNKKNSLFLKYVEIDIDILCHIDCQKTLRGTRDITIVTLLQEILEKSDLTGIAETVEITSLTEILGLNQDYNGYQLKITVVGFNQGLYED
jgi:hypothetical protein